MPVGRSKPPNYAIGNNILPPGRQLPSSLAASLAGDASTGGARVAGTQFGNHSDMNLPSNPRGGQSSFSVESNVQDNNHGRFSSPRATIRSNARPNLLSLPRTNTPRGHFHRLQAVSHRDHVQTPPVRLMDARSPPSKCNSHRPEK